VDLADNEEFGPDNADVPVDAGVVITFDNLASTVTVQHPVNGENYRTLTLSSFTGPTSDVAFVLSGADPKGEAWRRFTLSKKGPWRYELECFPTAFHNAKDPLSPGIPPSSSRRA